MANFIVAALYKFVTLSDYQTMQKPLFDYCESQQVKGTLLLAEEGINGTIAGTRAGIDAVLSYLCSDPRLATLEHKESWAEKMPFYLLKLKLKRAIVTMGVPNIKPDTKEGT